MTRSKSPCSSTERRAEDEDEDGREEGRRAEKGACGSEPNERSLPASGPASEEGTGVRAGRHPSGRIEGSCMTNMGMQ